MASLRESGGENTPDAFCATSCQSMDIEEEFWRALHVVSLFYFPV
jgi:hypothetical protein